MSRLRGAMRSTALRDPSPRAVLAGAGRLRRPDGRRRGRLGVLRRPRRRHRHPHLRRGRPPARRWSSSADGRTSFLPVHAAAAAGQPARRDDRSPSTCSSRARRWCCSPTARSPGATGAGRRRSTRLADVVPRGPAGARRAGGRRLGRARRRDRRAASGGPQGWPDDVAVLVAHRRERRAGAASSWTWSPCPPPLPGVRRRLGAWLAELGMGEQDRVGVMVAVGEACANAAEHAYRGRRARADVGARPHVDVDGVLTVTVRDEGTWRPPDRDPGRPGPRAADHAAARRRRSPSTSGDGHDGDADASACGARPTSTSTPVAPPAAAPAVVVDRDGERPVVSGHRCGRRGRRRADAHPAAGGQPRRHRRGWSSTSTASRCSAAPPCGWCSAIARIARDEGWRLVVHAPDGRRDPAHPARSAVSADWSTSADG